VKLHFNGFGFTLDSERHGEYLETVKRLHLALTREVCRRLREQWQEEGFTRPVKLDDLVSATQTEIEGRAA
jgi:hypothetical protein